MSHIYKGTLPNHPAILADMKMELHEAEQDMQKKWVEYRNTRPNNAALNAYTEAVDRCGRLKADIYEYQTGGAR